MNELLDKLVTVGWSLRSIDFKQGTYVAKADNEVTGQDIERTGRTPELALAAVLQFAQRAYSIRRNAGLRKFAAWDDDWLDDARDIGVAYAKMPVFDNKAVPAWKALAAESKIQADAIRKQITVEVVDEPEPYMSAREMVEDIHKNKHFSVSRANCEHPVWSPEDNINFRIVHDVLGHAQSGGDFTWVGENKACGVHFPLVSPLAREALFTECIGQQAYYRAFHGFGPQKVGFLSQFLHPVQERQGEHVWVPHGGIPDLQGVAPNMSAPGTMDQAPGMQALFNSPGEWASIDASQAAPPSPVMGPSAVMEGYRTPKKPNLTSRAQYAILRGDGHAEDQPLHQGAREEAPAERVAQASQAQVTASPIQVGDYLFPEPSDAFEIAPHVVDNYQGVRDPNSVASGVQSATNQHAYGGVSDPFELAAHLINGVQRNQGFVEGNKRTGTALGLMFLASNGYENAYELADEPYAEQMEELIVGMAEGKYSPEALADYMRQTLTAHTAKTWGLVRVARLHGFHKWSKDIHELAEKQRTKALHVLEPWIIQQKAKAAAEKAELEQKYPEGVPSYERVEENKLHHAQGLIRGIPDQGFKMIPWAAREITRGALDTQGYGHLRDIFEQASHWLDWCREHNKQLPQINDNSWDFAAMEQWVYEMSATQREGDQWADSTPVFTWDDGWHMDRVGPTDLALEGELMGHCVGGYANSAASGSCSIYSLRDPQNQPHVTVEVSGDPDLTRGFGEVRDHQRRVNIVQVQGKQDTEPIAEYRDRVNDWYQHLRDDLGWEPEENDPEREPEYAYINHLDGPMDFNSAENVAEYGEIMKDKYDRDSHFAQDEEGDWDNHPNVVYYQNPRPLVGVDVPNFVQHTREMLQNVQDGEWNEEDALHYIQSMWMAVHHSHANHGPNTSPPPDDFARSDGLGGWYAQEEWNSQQADRMWDQIVSSVEAELTTNPIDNNPSQYGLFDNNPIVSPMVRAVLEYMHRLSSAPKKWNDYVPRNPSRFAPNRPYGVDTINRALHFPGGDYTSTDFSTYFKDKMLDSLKLPNTYSSWHPLASRDPDYLFVYYKSELRVKKWEHNLREADMLQELLDEFNVDMTKTGLDIDPAEVAAGEIFTYPDGEYRVEHKQLSNPEVREHAEDLLDERLCDWRSIDQVRDPATGQFV